MKKQNKKGFTLIELLLVITIISILAGVIMPKFFGRSQDARKAAAKQMIMGTFSLAIDMYEQDKGHYPANLGDLAPDYINSGSIPNDPWGNAYNYSVSGSSYFVTSDGPDGNAGNGDDITR